MFYFIIWDSKEEKLIFLTYIDNHIPTKCMIVVCVCDLIRPIHVKRWLIGAGIHTELWHVSLPIRPVRLNCEREKKENKKVSPWNNFEWVQEYTNHLFLKAATRLERKPISSCLPRADIASNFSQAWVWAVSAWFGLHYKCYWDNAHIYSTFSSVLWKKLEADV